jgi:hypothetical protein
MVKWGIAEFADWWPAKRTGKRYEGRREEEKSATKPRTTAESTRPMGRFMRRPVWPGRWVGRPHDLSPCGAG